MSTARFDSHLSELSFTVQPRPLRFLYCVANRGDFDAAVAFFTHVWGGGANWILPIPASEEREAFSLAFDCFDPDYVVIPKRDEGDNSLSQFTSYLREKCPARLMALGPETAPAFGALQGKIGCPLVVGCPLVGRGSSKLGFVPAASPMVSHHHQGGLKPADSRVVLSASGQPASGQQGSILSLWQDSQSQSLAPPAFWEFLLRLKTGIPCREYEEYLKKGLGAASLRSPQTYFDALKAQLVCCDQATTLSLSTVGCTLRGTNFSDEARAVALNRDYLGLYLVDDWPENPSETERDEWLRRQLPTLCSYWNCHSASDVGVVLPRNEFRQQMAQTFQICSEAFSRLRGIYLVTTGDEAALRDLQAEAEAELRNQLEEDKAFVVVRQSGFDFPSQCLRPLCGIKTTLSTPLRADNSLVFRPPVPVGLERQNENTAFACDVEVKGKAGQRLALPDAPQSALSLSLSAEAIAWGERADQESASSSPRPSGGWRQNHLESASMRPAWDGITLIATCAHETLFFLPEEETLVRRCLEAKTTVKLRPNRHTRYMLGVINRAGGADKAMALVRSIGLTILKLLSQSAAHQCGLELSRIAEKARKAPQPKIPELSGTEAPPKPLSGEQKKQAAQLERQKHHLKVREELRELIERDLVRRGVALSCPLCDLKEWFAVSEIRETVTCPGCGSQFSLPFESPAYFYKANELVVRCLESGGSAILEAAAALRSVENAGSFMFGAELIISGGQESEVEIDLLWLVDETLVVAECKSFHRIGDRQLEELRESLPKAIQAAVLLGAKTLIVGISTTDSDWTALYTEIEAVKEEAKRQQIVVRLLVNSLFCQGTEAEPVEPWRTSLDDLLFPIVQEEASIKTFGKWPSGWHMGEEESLCREQIKIWKSELSVS